MSSWKKLLLGIGIVMAVAILAWFATEPLRVKAEEFYLKRGDDSWIAGNLKDALIQYKKASFLVWTDSEPHYRAGAIWFENRDFEKAQIELKKALAHQPENFDARAGLAQIYNIQGKFAEALELLLKTPEIMGLESIKHKTVALQAQNFLALQKIEKASQILDQYEDSHDPSIKYFQILTLLLQENYNEAAQKIAAFKLQIPTLEEEPKTQSPKIESINNTKIKKDFPIFEKAINQIQKTSSQLTQQLITAQLFYEIKLPRMAVQIAEKITQTDDKYRDAWVVLAESYLELKEYSKAKDALDKALKIDPIYTPAWKLLGRVSEATGEAEKAKQYYEKAEKLK